MLPVCSHDEWAALFQRWSCVPEPRENKQNKSNTTLSSLLLLPAFSIITESTSSQYLGMWNSSSHFYSQYATTLVLTNFFFGCFVVSFNWILIKHSSKYFNIAGHSLPNAQLYCSITCQWMLHLHILEDGYGQAWTAPGNGNSAGQANS